MRQVLYKTRRKELPKLPQYFSDIVIPDHLQNSATNERFLQRSAEIGDKKIFIFTTPKLMECLCRSSTVFGDGTFYCVPRPFSQLYILHGIINGQTLPLAFCLLPDKSNNVYIKMLKEICHISVEMHLLFNPQNVMIDFEQASMQPFLPIFLPGANKILLLPFRAIIMEKMSKPWIAECIK